MDTFPKPQIVFRTGAVPDDTLQVVRVEGREEISTPYLFELELVSQKDDVDLALVMQQPVTLVVDRVVPSGSRSRLEKLPIHGVLRSFEQRDPGAKWSRYHAILQPRFALLDLTLHSRIFQEKTVRDIVSDILQANGLPSDAFEFRLSGSYKPREYVVQYQESDFAFVSRLLEHEGIFYFFEQEDAQEKIVFADATTAHEDLPGGSGVVYRQPAGMADFDMDDAAAQPREAVQSFVGRVNAVPAKVILKDYNYRKPSVELKAEADVAEKGKGDVFEYGNHFKDNAEGTHLAKVRSEEIRCREAVFNGRSDCRGMRAGFVFELSEGYRSDLDGRYLVTEVRHAATQHVAYGPFLAGENPAYTNEFRAIKADVVFRPERRTPKPRIVGSINAHVDAAGKGDYAEIDDEGRYKVQLPFDLSGRKDAKASRYLRMAQPYAGANMGMHFPLHKGTEVILTHIGGDPDRPIIAAAVPNAETKGPVTGGNQTQCAIRTGGGNQIVIEDSDGGQRIKMSTPHADTSLQLGSPNNPGEGVVFNTAKDYIRRTGANVKIETNGNEFKLTKGDSASETQGNTSTWTKGNTTAETIGDSQSTVTGNSTSTVVGNSTSSVQGSSTSTIVGSTSETFNGSKSSVHVGTVSEKFAGAKSSLCAAAVFEGKAAVSKTITGGAAIDTFVGGKVEAGLSGVLKITKSAEKNLFDTWSARVSGKQELQAGTIHIDGMSNTLIEAGSQLKLVCGSSSITMTSSSITIKSTTVTIEASGSQTVKGSGSLKLEGGTITSSGPINQN